MTVTPDVELKEMLSRGPVQDIFRADEARAIYEIIGTNAAAIDASSYAPTFVALQAYAVEVFVMAIARMFDQPKERYQLRSLPAIIEYVAEHSDELPIKEPAFVETALTHLEGLTTASIATTQQLMAELSLHLPTSKSNTALEALKALRDKRLAHAEHVDAISTTQWQPAGELLRTAKLIVGALGGISAEAFLDSNGD